MGVGQFVELPIAQFSTFVFDLYAHIKVVNHRNSLTGEPLVLSDGIHQIENFVVIVELELRKVIVALAM
jgi:hypothetical protein